MISPLGTNCTVSKKKAPGRFGGRGLFFLKFSEKKNPSITGDAMSYSEPLSLVVFCSARGFEVAGSNPTPSEIFVAGGIDPCAFEGSIPAGSFFFVQLAGARGKKLCTLRDSNPGPCDPESCILPFGHEGFLLPQGSDRSWPHGLQR